MLVGPFLHFYVRNAPSQCFLLQKLQVLTPTLQARLVRRDGHKLTIVTLEGLTLCTEKII